MAFAMPAWAFLGSAGLGAAGSVAGGLLSRQNAVDPTPANTATFMHDFAVRDAERNQYWQQFAENAAFEREMLGYNMAYGQNTLDQQLNFAERMANAQMQFQREMAQNSIRWRVGDAQAAGVSPLVGLGAPTFSPAVSIGGGSPGSLPGRAGFGGDDMSGSGVAAQMGDPGSPGDWRGLSNAGVAMGDMLLKAMTQEDKIQAAKNEIMWRNQEKVQRQQIELNDIYIARQKQALGMPGYPNAFPESGPLGGQGNSPIGKYKEEPSKVSTTMPGDNSVVAGVFGEVQLNVTRTGLAPVPSKQAGIQDQQMDNPLFAQWMARQQFAKWEPPVAAGRIFPGAIGWQWSYSKWEFQPVYPKGSYINGRFVPRGHYGPGTGTGSIEGIMP